MNVKEKARLSKKKNSKGITLIALVITIIVLLILAGVSISMLTGQNGILTQVQKAKTETEQVQADEENTLANYESYLNIYSGENTEFTDSLGNIVKVPTGFRVVNPEDNVEDGIVIEDVTHGKTAGSQFVWIPVGTGIKKKDGTTFDIILGRYSFDTTTGEPSVYGGIYTEDTKEEHVFDNIPAKDINNFISKANLAGGYYIGRYEARTGTKRTKEGDRLTQVTVKQNDFVYNYVTQPQAANLSQNMYNDSNFTSDLINSYAWDTAIIFLQKCDDRENKSTPYSLQTSLNTGSLEEKGTGNDVICNIYDMASNCREWTTETSSNSTVPWVWYGSSFHENDANHYASTKSSNSSTITREYIAFRPILYL